jgi:hypothetical protein
MKVFGLTGEEVIATLKALQLVQVCNTIYIRRHYDRIDESTAAAAHDCLLYCIYRCIITQAL